MRVLIENSICRGPTSSSMKTRLSLYLNNKILAYHTRHHPDKDNMKMWYSWSA